MELQSAGGKQIGTGTVFVSLSHAVLESGSVGSAVELEIHAAQYALNGDVKNKQWGN
jgi:hypothetical protein